MTDGGRDIGFFQLVALGFFCVGGSIAGVEDSVHEVGPLIAIVIILCLSIFHAIPTIYMSSRIAIELDYEDKGAGGTVRFADNLWPYFSWMNVFLEIISAIVELSLYPKLIRSYTEIHSIEFLVVLVVSVFVLFDVSIVSNVNIFIMVYVLLVSMYFMCVPGVDIMHTDYKHDTGVFDIRLAVLVLLCNLSGFDNMTSFVHRVVDVDVNLPCAQMFVLALVILLYSSMIMCTYAYFPNSTDWKNGLFLEGVYKTHVIVLYNTFLTSIAGACFATTVSLMSFLTEMLQGAVEMRFLPSGLTRKKSTLLLCIVLIGVMVAPFDYLAEIAAVSNSMATLIQIYAWNMMETDSKQYRLLCSVSLSCMCLFCISCLDLIAFYVSVIYLSFLSISFLIYKVVYERCRYKRSLPAKIQGATKQKQQHYIQTSIGTKKNNCSSGTIDNSHSEFI